MNVTQIPDIPDNVATDQEVIANIALTVLSIVSSAGIALVLLLMRSPTLAQFVRKRIFRNRQGHNGAGGEHIASGDDERDNRMGQIVNNTIQIGRDLHEVRETVREMSESMTSSVRHSHKDLGEPVEEVHSNETF